MSHFNTSYALIFLLCMLAGLGAVMLLILWRYVRQSYPINPASETRRFEPLAAFRVRRH